MLNLIYDLLKGRCQKKNPEKVWSFAKHPSDHRCLHNKNILNCDERGEAGEISKQVFLKAFEIYIHATHYNTEDAFGCNQCPGELKKGENEDDFEDEREVHICDGIDMGNMQYPTKSMVEKDLFQVPKVPQVCIISICSLRHYFCQHF